MEYSYGIKDEYYAIESRRGWQLLFTGKKKKIPFIKKSI